MKITNLIITLIILLFTFACDEPTTEPTDCLGVVAGNAYEDACGICDTDINNDNITCIDCSGGLNGDYEFDDCNICNDYSSNGGLKPEYPYGDCDCAGEIIQIDVDGNSIGHARLDDCDVCNPGTVLNNPFGFIDIDCEDCNGDLGGDASYDGCGDCVGGNTGLDPCEIDCNGKTIISNLECAQFSDLLSCQEAPGCTYESGSACLPISYGYYDGCGNCVTEPDENCMQICDCQWSNDENIPLEYPLCIALQNCQSECNTLDNSECILIDSAYYCVEYENWNDIDCTGSCVSGTPENDNYYMYCSTTGSTFTELNYEVCTQGGGCNGECILFDHEIHSNAFVDDCGLCSGGITGHEENSDKDCTGTCFGEAFTDYCDSCVGGDTGLEACPTDCAGTPSGAALEDMCGVCDDDPSNDCGQDCAGTWGGDAIFDDCMGVCINIFGNQSCINGSNHGGSCTDDSDCPAICRDSIDDPDFNDECSDCADVPNGDALADTCGTCDNDSSNDCIADCSTTEDTCDGTWIDDECFGGSDTSCSDCAGVPNGNSLIDECGICDNDSSNDCEQDCSGIWGGNLVDDCAGECNGNAIIDDCNICDGDNSSCSDCADVPNGDALVDACGTCDNDASNDCLEATLSFGEITSSTIEIYMENLMAVGGFQFDLTGGTILSGTPSGGSAGDFGFSMSSSGTRVIGFSFTGSSIPQSGSCSDDQYTNQNDCESNSGTWTILTNILTVVSATSISEPICIENIIISDASSPPAPMIVSTLPICSE